MSKLGLQFVFPVFNLGTILMSNLIGIDKKMGPLEDPGGLLIKPHGVSPDSLNSNKPQHDIHGENPHTNT